MNNEQWKVNCKMFEVKGEAFEDAMAPLCMFSKA
jgi:hypothetical protein